MKNLLQQSSFKRSVWMLFITFSFLACSSYAAYAAPQLLIPKDGWLINNWKGQASTEISFETAPDNNAAVRIKFGSGAKIANAGMPQNYVMAASSNWPSQFNGFNIFVWNDGELRTIRITFQTAAEIDGKQIWTNFSSFLKVDHKGWKLISHNEAIDYQHRQLKLAPAQIKNAYVSVDRPAEIALGTLTWVPDGTALQRLDEGNNTYIPRTSTAPVIDGNGDDAAWKNAAKITLGHVLRSGSTPKNKTIAKLLYDDKNLYVLAVAPFTDRDKLKANINEFDAGVWDDECIEVMLYPGVNAQQYGQFIINPKGVRGDIAELFDQVQDRIVRQYKDWNPDWQGAAKIGANAWVAEMRIPWKSFHNGKRPSLMRLQIGRNDTTTGQYVLWAPSDGMPVSGIGVAALNEERGSGDVSVPSIAMRRDSQGTYQVDATVLGDHDLDGMIVNAYFCAPRTEPETFTKTFQTEGKSVVINFPIDSKKALNGKYLTALEFIPNNKNLRAKGVTYFFNQMIPFTTKFSDVILNPEPKNLAWGKSTFTPKQNDIIGVDTDATERTIKTAKYLADKMNGVYGFIPAIQKTQNGRLDLSIKSTFVKQKTGSDSPEAYLLDVTPEHVSIVGASEAGLYYGVVTFIQLMHGAKVPNALIRTVSIKDWPSYRHRVIVTYVLAHYKKYNGKNTGLQIARYKDWIERVVAGNKFNTLIMTWGNQVNYPSVPEVHHKDNFSPEEVADLFQFARDHFIEASPGVLFANHASSWKSRFPQLLEAGWGNTPQLDVTLPETFSFQKRLFGDLMDIAGKDAHYFVDLNDEWWHAGQTTDRYIYKGKTRQEIFQNYLLKTHQLITSKGKEMVMFTDMLLPKHNGGPPWNLSEVIDHLPKDIVMATWSPYSNDFFAKKGFKNTWSITNGFKGDYLKPSASDTGYGQIVYPLFGSLFDQTAQSRAVTFTHLPLFPAANYAWNKDTKTAIPTQDWVMQNMPAYAGSFSFKDNPAAGDKLTPIQVPNTAKVDGTEQITKLTSAGVIPVKAGAAFASPSSKITIALPPGTKASSFYILDAVYPNEKTDIAKLQAAFIKDPRSRPYGMIVGKYRINYADGSGAEMNIRLGRSIALYQYTFPPNRFCEEIRAVVPLSKDESRALTQLEWINLHPEKEIASFEVEGNYDYAPILLTGLTVRNVRLTSVKPISEIEN